MIYIYILYIIVILLTPRIQNLWIWIRTCPLTSRKFLLLLTNAPCCWGDDLIVPLTVPLIAPLAVPVTIPLIVAFPKFKVISQSIRPDIHWHATYWSQRKSLPVWKLGFGGAASSQTFCQAVFQVSMIFYICPILSKTSWSLSGHAESCRPHSPASSIPQCADNSTVMDRNDT